MKRYTWEELKEKSFDYSILRLIPDKILKEKLDTFEYLLFFKITGNPLKVYHRTENSYAVGESDDYLNTLVHYIEGKIREMTKETYRGESTGNDDKGWVIVHKDYFDEDNEETVGEGEEENDSIFPDEELPLKKETSRLTWTNLLAYSLSFSECERKFKEGKLKNPDYVYYRKTKREDGVDIGTMNNINYLKESNFDILSAQIYRKDWVVVPLSMFSKVNLSDTFVIPEFDDSFYSNNGFINGITNISKNILNNHTGSDGMSNIPDRDTKMENVGYDYNPFVTTDNNSLKDGEINSFGTIKNVDRLFYTTNNSNLNLTSTSTEDTVIPTETRVRKIVKEELEKINLTHDLNSNTIDSSNEAHINLIEKENNMTNTVSLNSPQRRTVTIQLFDEDKGLDGQFSLVGQWKDILTSDSDQVTKEELLLYGDVGEAIEEHNEIRIQQVNKDILARTGQKVFLEPIRLKDLKWKVI